MAQDDLAGKRVTCLSCGQPFQVPRPVPQTSPATIDVACLCGRTYKVPATMSGRRVQCNACQQQFSIPRAPGAGRPAAPAPASAPVAPGPLDFGPLGAGPLDNFGDLSNFGNTTALPQLGPTPSHYLAPAYPAPTYSAPMTAPLARSKRRPTNMKVLLSVAASVLVVLTIVGIGLASWTFLPPLLGKYVSPHQVWNAHNNAVKSRDWKTVYKTITPESRDYIVGTLTFLAPIVATQDEKMAALVKKYGLQPMTFEHAAVTARANFTQGMQLEQHMSSAGNSIQDKQAFFVETLNQLGRIADERREQFGGKDFAFAMEGMELKDVVIEGDQARGKQRVQRSGRTLEVPIYFRRVDGSWLIHMAPVGTPIGNPM